MLGGREDADASPWRRAHRPGELRISTANGVRFAQRNAARWRGEDHLSYDACGIAPVDFLAGFDIQERGEAGHSVNADFYYGHFPESWPGLLVMFPSRGRSAFVFDESITDAAALSLIETLATKDPADDPCFVD